AAPQERITDVGVIAEAPRPVGVVGAVVSGSGGVVTDNGADGAEALPAASKAETVNECGVLAESPVIETKVLLGEATSVPSRYTRSLLAATPFVAAPQERVSEVGVIAEAARPVGVVGAVVSGSGGVVTDNGADDAEALP